jgi:c(7)-type cytochrome triheme protein
MRPTRPFALILGLAVFAAIGLAVAPADAQKIPADITYEQGKDSPGVVTFSHTMHKEAADKCTACHTKIFKMKKTAGGEHTMAKMKAGESCGACHNGKTEIKGKKVFGVDDKATCGNCHKKKS